MSSAVEKSYESSDKLIAYTTKISTTSFAPIQQTLQDRTLAEMGKLGGCIGAPEVLEMGKAMIHLTRASKVIDIGTFTGASALAWAVALPEGGKVISMDVTHEYLNKVGLSIIENVPELRAKIDFRLGAAVDTLQSLIDTGESGTFSFAFIDADKANYSRYYELCLQLLAPGGVIMVDNALWRGSVVEPTERGAIAIDAANRKAAADSSVFNTLLNVGDGVHLIVKKHC